MSIFQFKQFAIRQDRCAMKVNTDGVLLGAWANLDEEATHILDIGTGTGVLALMAAQRHPTAHIHAVEIEPDAAQQAADNAAQSPFADRISVQAQSVQTWATDPTHNGLYRHIWSNPPYYPDAHHLPANGTERQLARSTIALSFDELLANIAILLHPQGHCSLVLPIEAEAPVQLLATRYELYIQRLTRVVPRIGKPANRVLLQLGKQKQPLQATTLTIRQAGTGYHDYTTDYIELLKEFYTIF